MYKIFISCLLILISINVFCVDKNNNIYSLTELNVINPNLLSVLDSIVQTNCYAKASKLYTVEFNEDSLKTDLIFVRAQGKYIYSAYFDLGYFNYKNHTFIVRGDSLDGTIFKKNNFKRNFKFSSPPTEYTAKGIPILETYEDFAVWSIRYKLGLFKLLSFFSSNRDDHWFDNIKDEYGDTNITLRQSDPSKYNK